jgi:hypothetical protein
MSVYGGNITLCVEARVSRSTVDFDSTEVSLNSKVEWNGSVQNGKYYRDGSYYLIELKCFGTLTGRINKEILSTDKLVCVYVDQWHSLFPELRLSVEVPIKKKFDDEMWSINKQRFFNEKFRGSTYKRTYFSISGNVQQTGESFLLVTFEVVSKVWFPVGTHFGDLK